jgi:hypothetical protein
MRMHRAEPHGEIPIVARLDEGHVMMVPADLHPSLQGEVVPHQRVQPRLDVEAGPAAGKDRPDPGAYGE